MSKFKQVYPQKFRKEWLKVFALSKWPCEIPTDSPKVQCDILAKCSDFKNYDEIIDEF